MKIKKLQFLLAVLVLMATLSLFLVVKSHYVWILCVGLVPLLIRRNWARVSSILYLAVLMAESLGVLSWALVKVEEKGRLIEYFLSCAFTAGISVYGLAVMSSRKVKRHYVISDAGDPMDGPGWKCPKCGAKMLHAVVCWNCGFKQEDLSKPQTTASPVAEESDKIDIYIQKKKETENPGTRE